MAVSDADGAIERDSGCAGAVGFGGGGGGDRRLQVRHHDRAGELAGAVRQHAGQGGAVAQVQVPVVRAGDGDAVGGVFEVGHGCGLSGYQSAKMRNPAILPAAGPQPHP